MLSNKPGERKRQQRKKRDSARTKTISPCNNSGTRRVTVASDVVERLRDKLVRALTHATAAAYSIHVAPLHENTAVF